MVGAVSDLKPTPARLRAMREACSAGWSLRYPLVPEEDRACWELLDAGLVVDVGRLTEMYSATDAGRAWLARHDKPAEKPQEGSDGR